MNTIILLCLALGALLFAACCTAMLFMVFRQIWRDK